MNWRERRDYQESLPECPVPDGNKEFYVVLNATGGDAWRGMVKYGTEGLAVIAAQARVEKYPHIEYYICRAVKVARKSPPPVEITDLCKLEST